MGFFKDLKQDSNKTNEETAKKDASAKKIKTDSQDSSEDVLDEDMYKDILAAAEEMLTDEEETSEEESLQGEKSSKEDKVSPKAEDSSEESKMQDNASSQKENKNNTTKVKQHKEKNEKEEKVENTMVDYDENAVDSEILDTLLKDEDSTEKTVKEEKVEQPKPSTPNPELTAEDKEAVTVITKGTTINGSITSDCSLDIMGTINGDIECAGKLSISGKVIGNSMANEVYVNTDRLEGSISSEGSVKVAVGTVVIGDITATSGVFAGAVKGEIDVTGPVVIDSTAIIKGNVKAKSVQMNNGAVLDGYCSLAYSDVDIDDIFQ